MTRSKLPSRAFAVAILILIAIGPSGCTLQGDLLIRGGTVIDGTGAPGRVADVLIADGKIHFLGPDCTAQATRTIDATGKVVTPGFIDPHAHGDPRRTPGFENFIAMGVTTICLGQDGSSPAGMPFAKWLAVVQRGKIRPNIVPFVGHGTLRREVGIGLSSNPSAAQLRALGQSVRDALDAGAFGVSMGLEYEPGRFAKPEELAIVCRAVHERGGMVMAHVRNEDNDALEDALEEFCRAHPPGGRAHISHMKSVYGRGKERAEELLATLALFRESGRVVTADVYPYVASYTGIGIVFPHWARPPAKYDEVKLARREELLTYLRNRVNKRNGPESTLFGNGKFAGKTLAQVAEHAGKPFEEVLLEIGPRGASAAYFVMDRVLMQRLLSGDHVMVCSDGSPTMRHPRGHGTFARILRELVNEHGALSLETAIHKMTGLTAQTLGLSDRGTLAVGQAADLLVFDPKKIEDRATFANPFQRAEGFDTVLIGGTIVRENGRFTDAKPGRLLLR